MDTMLQALLSWQFLLFCLALAAITFVVRKIVEYVLDNPSVPASKESKFWKELALPILPVLLGCVGAVVAKQYPYPDGLTSISGRVAFGLVAGLLSGLVYRVVNSFLVGKVSNLVPSAQDCDQNTDALADQVRQSINK